MTINFWNNTTVLANVTSAQTVSGNQPFTQIGVQAVAPAGTTGIRIEAASTGPAPSGPTTS